MTRIEEPNSRRGKSTPPVQTLASESFGRKSLCVGRRVGRQLPRCERRPDGHREEPSRRQRRRLVNALRRNAEVEDTRFRFVETAIWQVPAAWFAGRRTFRTVLARRAAAVFASGAAGRRAASTIASVVWSPENLAERFARRCLGIGRDDATRGCQQADRRGAEKRQ
jgi:hypothetical protein